MKLGRRLLKRTLRGLSLAGLFAVSVGFQEFSFAASSNNPDANGKSSMPMTKPVDKNKTEREPAQDCMVKKTGERICVRKNDRIELDRYDDQARPQDFVSAKPPYEVESQMVQ